MTSPTPTSSISFTPTPISSTTATVGVATPSPTQTGTDSKGASGIQVATLLVAIGAVCATGFSAWLLRKTGRETSKAAADSAAAAKKSAGAAETSADASQRSAKAAEDSVALSAETARTSGIRSDAEALSKRYQEAASQLGHNKAAVRLAGVYAMARLADDWPEERQTCVDVLCAYLRLPWATPSASDEDFQVRSTIWSTINRHIGDGFAGESWSALRFDFSGATLLGVFLEKGTFTGEVIFDGATFIGFENFISEMTFAGRTGFFRADVAGGLGLIKIKVTGKLLMTKLKQSGKPGYVAFDFTELGSEIVMASEVEVAEKLTMIVGRQNERSTISMTSGKLADGAILSVVGRTLAPVIDPTVSMVFPDVDMRQWTVGARASVKTVALRPEGNVEWSPAAQDPTASVEIA